MARAAHAIGVAVIERETVAKSGIVPVVGVMALTALAREVIVRLVAGMAGNAVRLPGMIERRIAPIVGVVTRTTLAREMVRWFIGRVAT